MIDRQIQNLIKEEKKDYNTVGKYLQQDSWDGQKNERKIIAKNTSYESKKNNVFSLYSFQGATRNIEFILFFTNIYEQTYQQKRGAMLQLQPSKNQFMEEVTLQLNGNY